MLKWFKRKTKCEHKWHHLLDQYISNYNGFDVDLEDGCYIFCSKCKNEKLVYKEEWIRIKKKQDILKDSKQLTQEDLFLNKHH